MRVITFGVFDYFHYGHLKLFEQAKQYGDFLIVGVQTDSQIKIHKPNHNILYSVEQRMEIIKSLRIVDEVFESYQVDIDIIKHEFDILALGEDQNHSGFEKAIKWCEENGKKVIRLKRTKDISSSQIKKFL